MSADQLGQILDGLTPRRVRQLAEQGVIPKASRGRYPVIEAVQGYVRFLKNETRSARLKPDDDRFRRARADVHEIDALERMGELVPKDEFFDATLAPLTAFLSALDAAGVRIGTDYGKDVAKIRELYDTHVGGAREVFADDLGKLSSRYRSLARSRKASAKKNA